MRRHRWREIVDVLNQKSDAGKNHLITFCSKKQQAWVEGNSTIQKECLEIKLAM